MLGGGGAGEGDLPGYPIRPCLLLLSHSHGCWVHRYNSSRSVAHEISCVESKDVSHAVDNHSSGNAGVVDLDA
jgi:hypothetical protein